MWFTIDGNTIIYKSKYGATHNWKLGRSISTGDKTAANICRNNSVDVGGKI